MAGIATALLIGLSVLTLIGFGYAAWEYATVGVIPPAEPLTPGRRFAGVVLALVPILWMFLAWTFLVVYARTPQKKEESSD